MESENQKNKSFFSKREEELQKFWKENQTFEKSIEQRDEKDSYVFYDGPPFATGTPHYGHIVTSTMKDIVPRYWTMKGKRVERKWGWDCHGLPVENIVEKELNLNSRKDIEELGVDKFNQACETKIDLYADVWKQVIPRIGRWVDMDDDYKTMDLNFMESVWWVFKSLYDKDLIYEGHKSMHVCPRCETTLSNLEVGMGYQDVKDLSVITKFELVDEPGTYVLAWTTTPWTLIGNVALAVGAKIDYVKVKNFTKRWDKDGKCIYENLILSKEVFENYKNDKSDLFNFGLEYTEKGKEYPNKTEVIEEFKGKDLENKRYKPLFDYFVDDDLPNKENLYKIVTADFVSTEDGTGVVHIAPAFGEDDMLLGQEKKLSFIQHVDLTGRFIDKVTLWAGLEVKPKENPSATDKKVIDFLESKGAVFSFAEYEHSYPHCWRCDTPLLNYATASWFVKVTAIKDELLKQAKNINWMPAHLKEGRFGKWLEGAKDWAISRSRYWGNPMPVWKCDKCDEIKVFGSVEELNQASSQQVKDIHKHIVDKVEFKCEKCGGTMKRIPEVLDCWVESGSMPYGQMHYPFENKEKFEANFPAEFIAEGVDQTRAWFYVLHVLSTALFGKNAYKNVVVNGIVLAEDGQKMSKSKKNYPDPMLIIDKYSADALRYYLTASGVMKAQDLCFSEKGVDEVFKKVILITTNVLNLFDMYQKQTGQEIPAEPKSKAVMDLWMVAKTNELIKQVTEKMDGYDLTRGVLLIGDFINELSTWYVRRSRDRIKAGGQQTQDSLATLGWTLRQLSLTMAPFMPFLAEHVWQKIGQSDSVHLQDWPVFNEDKIDKTLLKDMTRARQIVEMSLAARDDAKVKVRQPLQYLRYKAKKLSKDLEKIVADEINVKEVKHSEKILYQENRIVKKDTEIAIALNLELTEELQAEGNLRELIRNVNNLRKNSGLTIDDQVVLYWQTESEDLQKIFCNKELVKELQKSVLAQAVINEKKEIEGKLSKDMNINDEKIWVGLEVSNQ